MVEPKDTAPERIWDEQLTDEEGMAIIGPDGKPIDLQKELEKARQARNSRPD